MKKAVILLFFSTFLLADSTVSGKVFFNHTTDLDENGMNAFNMKRAYLSYANSVRDDLFYNVTYDMGNKDGDSAYTAFLKIAMVKWKTNLGDVILGMQGMNMFKTMENTWGHRFIAKMPMDIYGYSASADLGVGITRSFGLVSTSALFTNGTGFKKSETDSHKKVSFHTVYGESQLNKNDGYNLGMSFSYEPYDQEIIGALNVNQSDSILITVENSSVFGLFSGYSGHKIRVGFEFDKKGIKGQNSHIISSYGTANISDKISILGRFDQFDADTDFEGGLEQSIIAGVHYNAENGLTIAPTLRIIKPEDGDAENSIEVNFQFKF